MPCALMAPGASAVCPTSTTTRNCPRLQLAWFCLLAVLPASAHAGFERPFDNRSERAKNALPRQDGGVIQVRSIRPNGGRRRCRPIPASRRCVHGPCNRRLNDRAGGRGPVSRTPAKEV